MRVLCFVALLASACAFTTQPAAFTTSTPLVGERVSDNVVSTSGSTHSSRRGHNIHMDGKANGEFSRSFSTSPEHVRTFFENGAEST
jgi:hypothetical protein